MNPSPSTPDPFAPYRPVSAFVSRCSNAGLSAASREDSMYQTPWSGTSAVAWLSREKAVMEHERTGTAYPPGAILDKEVARDHVATHAPTAAAVIGALAVHGTLHVEQVAAFVGVTASDLIASNVLHALWSMNALKVGHVRSDRSPFWTCALWTIDDKRVINKDVVPMLSQAEVLAMTAGQKIHASQGHDRHAVLIAGLGLGIAEFTQIGTVLGEGLSDLKSLFGHDTTSRRGDLVAVRSDGVRVVFEVVAHDNQGFTKKVDFWAEQLASSRRGAGMTAVVFVIAPDPGGRAPRARGLEGRVSAAIVNARAKYGAAWRGYARMGMVSWHDWFPGPGVMSAAFPSLVVRFPQLAPDQGSILSDIVVPGSHPNDPEYLAVIENASLFAQTPAWLRSREVAEPLLERMGMPALRELPSPPPARPDRPRSRSGRRGAAGRAQRPPRLMGIPGEQVDRRARAAAPTPPAPPPAQRPPSTTVVRRRQRPSTSETPPPVQPPASPTVVRRRKPATSSDQASGRPA